MGSNTKLSFRVICNEKSYLQQTIDWYNNTHNTDFSICKMHYDQVAFAEVEVSNFKPSDLFAIGYQFGAKEQMLRQQGEIER